jgi:hypothetical protein
MVGIPGTTEIHKAGLAECITQLVKMGWSQAEIRRHIKLNDGIELSHDQLRYFSDKYGEPPDEGLEKRIAAVRESQVRNYDVVYERQKYARMLMATIEILIEQEEARGSEAWRDGKARHELQRLGDSYNKTLDAVKRDMFDTNRLSQATSEPAASVTQIESINVVQALVEKAGIDENAAVNAVLLATYGAQRLGYTERPGVCDRALDDQGREILADGASIPETTVRRETSAGSVQESDTGGSE